MKPFLTLGLLISTLLAAAVSASPACCASGDSAVPACCAVKADGAAPACCAAKTDAKTETPAAAETRGNSHPVLDAYTRLSEALVADDAAATRAAANALAENARTASNATIAELAETLAEAEDLAQARERLIPLSRQIIELAADTEGYFVMSCPMVRDGEWLQRDREVRNPYMGQSMVRCGVLKRATGI